MFTKEGVRDYLVQVGRMEERARDVYVQLEDKVNREEYKSIFSNLAREESEHKAAIDRLLKLLE